jgi:SAM-dependent methyltransferase
MPAPARAHATGGADVTFEVAAFGELAQTLALARNGAQKEQDRSPKFDAVLCLGNSLPHVLTPADLTATLEDFADCLRPGGLLLIQNRNFDAVLAEHDRWMGPQAHREEATDWLFLRFYDFDPDGLLTFNILRLRREDGRDWSQEVTSTRLWPLTERELTPAVRAAGFADITPYGDMQGAPFDSATSPNLVIAAVVAR